MSASVNWCIGLCHKEIFLAICGKVFDLVDHPAFFHLAIRRLDETKLIDASKCTHRADQTDIWPFRCLDRTNAAVMRWMDIAHLKSGTFPAETSRPESRQAPLVCQFGKRIGLIHELRKL